MTHSANKPSPTVGRVAGVSLLEAAARLDTYRTLVDRQTNSLRLLRTQRKLLLDAARCVIDAGSGTLKGIKAIAALSTAVDQIAADRRAGR